MLLPKHLGFYNLLKRMLTPHLHGQSWYATLPPAVKSYIEALATQVSEGGVNLSATPTPNTSSGSIAGGTSAAKVKSTTSSKALAAQATGTVALGFMAAVGVLGVAIVL